VKRAIDTRRFRIGTLMVVLLALFAAAGARLALIVLVDGPRLSMIARAEHTSEMRLAALRGPIVDRDGAPLALSAETRSIYARPRRLLESTSEAERARLAELIGAAPNELAAKLNRAGPFVWLARHLPQARGREVEDLGFDGVGSVSEYQRFYPESNLAAAVVGMAGMDGQGLSGTELQYDSPVRGEAVELSFYHDALGHPIFDSPLALRSARPGARLELTIDSTIQAAAENYLAQEVASSGARRGAAVVLDPFTGEVLAMANTDPDGENPRLHNAAVQDVFEPGSTMKGLLGAIALDDHVINPEMLIDCENGEWRLAGHTLHDDSPHHLLDLGGIIEVSSNIGAAKIALRLGAQRFARGLAGFGLGRRTGIDLPGEAAGLLRGASTWGTIELADHGFGQGVAVTPLQLAVAYGAIANGGVLMRPYVARAAYDDQGKVIFRNKPQALDRAISPDTAHTINLLLRNVVNGDDGTGRLAQVADFTVAGKTGTAQMVNPATGAYYQDRLVASFVGFLPADDPRFVILVVLYGVGHGHFGGLVAAPVFSAIASTAVRRLDVTPAKRSPSYDTASLIPFLDDGRTDGADADAGEMGVKMSSEAAADGDSAVPKTDYADRVGLGSDAVAPDFRGVSLRAALGMARARGVTIEISGNGFVQEQIPAPGAALNGDPIRLILASGEEPDIPHPRGRALRSGLRSHG
jgi:cell division protein FtsI (penicillin-binding protein 3)